MTQKLTMMPMATVIRRVHLQPLSSTFRGRTDCCSGSLSPGADPGPSYLRLRQAGSCDGDGCAARQLILLQGLCYRVSDPGLYLPLWQGRRW
jgi:hypothetical protein